jgi:hypothetical protein
LYDTPFFTVGIPTPAVHHAQAAVLNIDIDPLTPGSQQPEAQQGFKITIRDGLKLSLLFATLATRADVPVSLTFLNQAVHMEMSKAYRTQQPLQGQ